MFSCNFSSIRSSYDHMIRSHFGSSMLPNFMKFFIVLLCYSCMNADALQLQYKEYCRATKVLNDAERDEANKFAAILFDYNDECGKTFLRNSSNSPLSLSYQSDGISALLTCSDSSSSFPSEPIIRKGKQLYSLLLERLFMLYVGSDGLRQTFMKIGFPRNMADKSTWAQFTASCEFVLNYRKWHGGIILWHDCFDRAVAKSLAKKMTQKRFTFYDPEVNDTLGDDTEYLEVLDLEVHTECALHDCHNAFKWG